MEVAGRRLLKVVASAAVVGAAFIGGKYSEKLKNAATTSTPNEVSVQYKDVKIAYVRGKEENKTLLSINVTADGAAKTLMVVGGAVALASLAYAGYCIYRILKQNNNEQNNNEQNNNDQNNE